MTLTLVTLTITGSLTLTQFSRSSTATATAPLFCSRPPLRFPSGVGWVLNLPCPSPSACDNLHCPLTPSPRSSTRAATLAQRLSDLSRSLRRPEPVRYDARIATPQPANSRPG